MKAVWSDRVCGKEFGERWKHMFTKGKQAQSIHSMFYYMWKRSRDIDVHEHQQKSRRDSSLVLKRTLNWMWILMSMKYDFSSWFVLSSRQPFTSRAPIWKHINIILTKHVRGSVQRPRGYSWGQFVFALGSKDECFVPSLFFRNPTLTHQAWCLEKHHNQTL